MNGTWQTITQAFITGRFAPLQALVAQVAAPAAPATPAPTTDNPLLSPITQFLAALGLSGLGSTLLNLIGGILILILGWIVAAIVSGLVRKLLERTDFDNRIARSLAGSRTTGREPKVEKIISSVVFWIILLIAVVAFLDALQLTTVSQPLNAFLSQVLSFLPRLGGAVILAAIAWVLATLAKTLVTRAAQSFNLDERAAATNPDRQFSTTSAPGSTTRTTGTVATGDRTVIQEGTAVRTPGATGTPTGTPTGVSSSTTARPTSGEASRNQPENQFLLSETLGNVLYWLVFLFFLPLILGVLDLQGPLQPVQNLLNDILAALPRILKAVLIGAIGWALARIVRGIVTNLLTATGIDRIGSQFGLRRTSKTQSLSWLIGTLVYVLILIPTAIAALDALGIPAISGPATSMLNQILSAVPQIFTAALILAVAYVVARFVADLVKNLLAGIGFDNVFQWIGLRSTPNGYSSRPRNVVPDRPAEVVSSPLPVRSPSDIAGLVVLVGIMLFATVAATNVLNIPALTAIVSGLLVIFGRVLVGLLVFAVGLYLANFVFNLIRSSGNSQAPILAQTARVAIIGFVAAMALQQMGIAASIVNLAFGLLLGAVALSLALAFGLGCRGIASARVEQWLDSFDRNSERDRTLR
jgi:small-conductance mechanosensitive channel